MIGFYAALVPKLLADGLHQKSPAISGSVVFGLFAVAAAFVVLTSRLTSRTAMLGGSVVLLPSIWLLLAAELTHSMVLLLYATAVGGLSAALGYRGSLEEANRIAPSEQRSEGRVQLFSGGLWRQFGSRNRGWTPRGSNELNDRPRGLCGHCHGPRWHGADRRSHTPYQG